MSLKKNLLEEPESNIFKGQIVCILVSVVIIVFWVFISGIGNMVWQNSDHAVRNALFRALIEYDWPVINADGSRHLIYYIGFWLPSAAIGKIAGLDVAYIIQFLWAVIGVVILYYLICLWRKKVDLWPLIVMIFF